MKLPGISCFCSTYGRPKHVIENSIACFLEQDWAGPKELVILNDFEDQTLVFSHPEVRIINQPTRIKPLGKKFNVNVGYCQYDIIAVWEDDDYFLRNRLTYSYNNMKNGIFHTSQGFHEVATRNIIMTDNIFHSTHMFDRKLFNKVGGYNESSDSCEVDLSIIRKFEAELGHYSHIIDREEDRFYIYVWAAGQSYHGSGWGPEKKNISDGAADVVASQIRRGVVQTGVIKLQPNLKYNVYEYLPKQKQITQ